MAHGAVDEGTDARDRSLTAGHHQNYNSINPIYAATTSRNELDECIARTSTHSYAHNYQRLAEKSGAPRQTPCT